MSEIDINAYIGTPIEEFIKKYGIEYIQRLDDESNGIFSSPLWDDNQYIFLFADVEKAYKEKNPDGTLLDIPENFSYEDFKKRIHDLIVLARYDVEKGVLKRNILVTGDIPPYEFVSGEFRKEYTDIFLGEEELVSSGIEPKDVYQIRLDFYCGKLSSDYIHKYPQLVDILKDKDLAFLKSFNVAKNKTTEISSGAEKSENTSETPFDLIDFLSQKLGKETFLHLLSRYPSEIFQTLEIDLKQDISLEELEKQIQKQLYEKLLRGDFDSSIANLPEEFKKEHPEFFLSSDAPEKLKELYYNGSLKLETLKKHPKSIRFLRGKQLNGRIETPQRYDSEIKTKQVHPLFSHALSYKQQIHQSSVDEEHRWLSNDEILDLIQIYGRYLLNIEAPIYSEVIPDWNKESHSGIPKHDDVSFEKKKEFIFNDIVKQIQNRKISISPNLPDIIKERVPELTLPEDAPELLKLYFYNAEYVSQSREYPNASCLKYDLNFKVIKEHPEWQELLKTKNLQRIMSFTYGSYFDAFDIDTLFKLINRNAEILEEMKEIPTATGIVFGGPKVKKWYEATGGKFLPNHIVMEEFPEDEIDNFVANANKWSQLMQIEKYKLELTGKYSMLRAAYVFGLFGDKINEPRAEALADLLNMFTEIPKEISKEEFDMMIKRIRMVEISDSEEEKTFNFGKYGQFTSEQCIEVLQSAYKLNSEGNYRLQTSFYDEKTKTTTTVVDKRMQMILRNIFEKVELPESLLLFDDAHQLFGAFDMQYNPDFVKLFMKYRNEIISNSDLYNVVASVQRNFEKIMIDNSGRALTLEMAINYIKKNPYINVNPGNERLANYVKFASPDGEKGGYSQQDFEDIQEVYEKQLERTVSSIPRVLGETETEGRKYTYEMLRLDDPLTLVIGALTECCQDIKKPGETSMLHSALSENGRVFVVRDEKGAIVAQSWVWRNGDVICFDNIEMPDRILKTFEKSHPELGRETLISDVLSAYKKATDEIIKVDFDAHQKQVEKGNITQEESDELKVSKVTVGIGYNDIRAAIKRDKDLKKDDPNNLTLPENTEMFPWVYTDAKYVKDSEIYEGQWIIKQTKEHKKRRLDELKLYEDDVEVCNKDNFPDMLWTSMTKMKGGIVDYEEIPYNDMAGEEGKPSEKMKAIAEEYDFDSDSTKLLTTPRTVVVVEENEKKCIVGDVLIVPLREGLTEEQIKKGKMIIENQLKRTIKQLQRTGKDLDFSRLSETQKKIIEDVLRKIEEERSER